MRHSYLQRILHLLSGKIRTYLILYTEVIEYGFIVILRR